MPYTPRQKAAVYAELTANNGNLKKTARNTGVNITTVRKWSRDWAANGLPEEIQNEVLPVIGDFLEDAIRVRGKLLIYIEQVVDSGKIQPNQAVTALNVLSDKIRAYEQTKSIQQIEHKVTLPPPEELKELMTSVLSGVVEAARSRADTIEALEEPTTTFRELSPAKGE